MRNRLFVALLMMVLLAACGGDPADPASEQATPSAAADQTQGAAAFRKPKPGATVKSPVVLRMASGNIKIEKAGKVRKVRGHFHVMVDTKCVPNGEVIPEDAKHVHFGDGSKKAKLKLKPGKHTLCLQVGNGAHEAFGNTDTVKIKVKK